VLHMPPGERENLGPEQPVQQPDDQHTRAQGRHNIERNLAEAVVGDEWNGERKKQRKYIKDGDGRKVFEGGPLIPPSLAEIEGQIEETKGKEDWTKFLSATGQ